jgi:MoaA/NifB/PqqE/SkfB family radical SAM enzyme
MNYTIVIPTNDCNFNCYFCGNKNYKKKKIIELSSVEKLIKKASEKNYRYLHITGGGEPLSAKGMTIKIIEIAKKYGFKTTELNTNGSFINQRIIKELKNAGLDRIFLSIDYDHLQFFPYEKCIDVIKLALKNDIKVTIKTVNRKDTCLENLKLIRKISEDLGGWLINIPCSKNYCENYFIIFSPHGLIANLNFNFRGNKRMKNNILLKELKECKLEKLIFDYCGIGNNVVINEESNVLPCSSFHCLNHMKLYGFKLSKNKNIDDFGSLLNKITKEKLGFVKIYLRARRNTELKKMLNNKNFHLNCDLCFFFLKNRKNIEKITPPSKFELIRFILPRSHYFLNYYISDLTTTFMCTSEMLKIIGRMFMFLIKRN